MNIQKVLLKVWRAIRDFVARHIDSGVARESKKASCAALRLNASKNAFIKSSKNASRKACGSCTSRALLSLLVASATLLATFVIAPTYALSAGENAGEKVGTEKAEGAQSGSAKSEGEKRNPEQSESINTEPNKKNTGSSDTLKKNNKESNPVEKQPNAGNNGVDKAKSTDSAVKKNAKKKDVDSTESVKGTERSVNEKPELPAVCKGKYNTFKKCYSITYGDKTINIKGKDGESYNRVPQILTPTIKVAGKVQQTLPDRVWAELEKYNSDDSVKYAFFKGENDSYTAKSTKNSDGSIRFFASKWLVAKIYRFNVVIHYPDDSKSSTRIKAILAKDDLPKARPGDLKLSLYDFENAQAVAAISDNKITINPKPNSQGSSGSDTGSTDKKDTYDPINKLFIDSQSEAKPGFIYHRMICKTGSGDKASYMLDSVNGLSLSIKQFSHMENQDRPKNGTADNSALYEDDKYTEESQSWISGTPKSAGTFECEVFALKPSELKIEEYISGAKFPKVKETSTMIKEFDERVKTNKDMKLLFDDPKQNIVEDKWTNKADIQQGIDWDYKSVTIEVKSSEPPKPTIGDNDLTLKVYPFKDSTTALTSDNNKISAILGMSLKPFVDATSAADSANKITLRVLCSKGEKKGNAAGSGGTSTGDSSPSSAQSGSQTNKPSEQSQPSQTAGSPQAEEPLEYKTWSSNLAELGLSVPADDNQNTCHSNKEGEKTCESVDPSKKVAARTDMEVSIKPTEVGNYQCVVFALKQEALKTFDGLKGSLTPDSIKSELTKASPTAFKENKDFAAFKLNIDSVSKFTLPDTGGQSWNLQLGILAALLVNLLAAGFVVSQSERGRKLILGRWRGLCNHV